MNGRIWRALRAASLPLASAALALHGVSASGAERDAMDRAALSAARPERAVLLAAASAGERIVAVGERGIAILSDDQGRSWRQARVPVGVTLTAARFADGRNGMAVGHGGTVLTTADAGETWTRRLEGHTLARLTLEAARTEQDAMALKAAERLVVEGPDKPLMDVVQLDAHRAIATGAYGLTVETRDGGQTWVSWTGRLDNPKASHLYAVRARGEVILLAGELGLVLFSENGGRSFRRLETPYKGSFFTAEILPNGQLLLAGLRGNAWVSNDTGASWSQLKNPMSVSLTSSVVLADGSLLLGNQAGFVLAWRGDALVPVISAPMAQINGLLAHGGSVVALTMQGPAPVALATGDRK